MLTAESGAPDAAKSCAPDAATRSDKVYHGMGGTAVASFIESDLAARHGCWGSQQSYDTARSVACLADPPIAGLHN